MYSTLLSFVFAPLQRYSTKHHHKTWCFQNIERSILASVDFSSSTLLPCYLKTHTLEKGRKCEERMGHFEATAEGSWLPYDWPTVMTTRLMLRPMMLLAPIQSLASTCD